MENLKNEIIKNGLEMPLILAVSKITERAYLFEGNHRMIVLEELKVPWVPLKINYLFYNADTDSKYPKIPQPLHGNFPSKPSPADVGFEVRSLNPISYTSSDDE